MLKDPPAGVQVWSSCIAKQRSYAADDYQIGIFLDSLLTALNEGLSGTIQRPEEPLPLEPYVARVNEIMKEDLSRRKLEQVSRLTGKEAESGVNFDNNIPPAPDAIAALASAPADVAVNQALLESLTEQIGTPPVKVTHELALCYDALPPFSVEALQKYQSDTPNPDSPLRKAVKDARVVLWAIYPGEPPLKLSEEVAKRRERIRVQLDVLKDGYRAPADGNEEQKFKDMVEADKRRVALILAAIDKVLEELQSKEVVEARDGESMRWKANYDFILARTYLERAYLFEYQSMLGSMCKEFPPRDPALHQGWKLASQPNLQGDSNGKKSAKEARRLLDKIAKDNAGTPWEVLAKREKLTNLGLEWQPAMTSFSPKKADAENLLVNGSFEEGPETPGGGFSTFEKDSTALKGWVVSQGNIDVVDSLYWKAADGKRSLDMNGGTAGAISQTFKTKKGQKYRVRFALAGSPGNAPTEKRLQISAGGKTTEFTFDVTGKTRTDMGWVSKTWEFTAEADETMLEFLSLTEGHAGPALDDVVVVAMRE
jgi:choice-of-anchor C domain-containing protein